MANILGVPSCPMCMRVLFLIGQMCVRTQVKSSLIDISIQKQKQTYAKHRYEPHWAQFHTLVWVACGGCRLHFSLISMFPDQTGLQSHTSHGYSILFWRHCHCYPISFSLSSTCGSWCFRSYCLQSTFGFLPLQKRVEQIFHPFLLTKV